MTTWVPPMAQSFGRLAEICNSETIKRAATILPGGRAFSFRLATPWRHVRGSPTVQRPWRTPNAAIGTMLTIRARPDRSAYRPEARVRTPDGRSQCAPISRSSRRGQDLRHNPVGKVLVAGPQRRLSSAPDEQDCRLARTCRLIAPEEPLLRHGTGAVGETERRSGMRARTCRC